MLLRSGMDTQENQMLVRYKIIEGLVPTLPDHAQMPTEFLLKYFRNFSIRGVPVKIRIQPTTLPATLNSKQYHL